MEPVSNGVTARAPDLNRSNGEKYAADSQQTYTQALWTLVLALTSCVLGGTALAFAKVHGLNRSLRQVASELYEGAEQVAGAASQVAASSQTLAQGASDEAASLEETSGSTEEINSMARRNSEHSRAAAGLVTESQRRFGQTNGALEEMLAAMNEIDSQSGRSRKSSKRSTRLRFRRTSWR